MTPPTPSNKAKGRREYQTFEEFYPFYLSQHANRTCRRLHVVGTTGVISIGIGGTAMSLLPTTTLSSWALATMMPLVGYGFAWVGHFFFEKNKPATFTYPLWSLFGDFRMWYEIVVARKIDF
uniref:DUF962 domain-containing protein n=1 Tax=Grammatophora oceanica TaxID=210454 RepID=A0A7S1VQP8_9STRA|mmetsp:Transcript_53256/g.79542  ORF Transcript_53256/g.79542 Transcript_53256/m.79542 type:complete len:122 (+) Transcript_53256:93-458(+)